MFKKLACFTGWLLVLCLSLVFCFTLGLWQNWSTPGIVLFWLLMLLLTTFLWFVFLALRHAFREKKVHQLLEKYRLSRREYVLFNQWKAGADVIKHTRRKRNRLPWFLLTGEQCGKSTLLAGSGLPLFYGETDTQVAGPTRTLRWWFFRNLCVLDLSANFLSGVATFRQAWIRLSRWLMKMPPPAGIIIAVSVSELISGDLSALHTIARKQRALTEPLIRRFRGRIPIHIIVTQCDRFSGFSLWQKQLSEAQRRQPLGYHWRTPPHIDGQDPHWLRPLFASLQEGFSSVRLSMARPAELSAQDYLTLLDFPEQFAGLEPAVRYFLASLCEPNSYFSPALLSSLWFSATEPQSDNRGRRDSIFVHDLLAEKLTVIGQYPATSRRYEQPAGKTLRITALALPILWAGVAATETAGRLKPGLYHLSPDAAAAFIKADEQQPASPVITLPFAPVLHQQRRQLDARLAQAEATPRQLIPAFNEYRQRAQAADPQRQRELIFRLTDAVLTWEAMRDGAPLATLQNMPAISSALQQYRYPKTLSPLTMLAIERLHMRRPEGERWLKTARQLLVHLVNRDPDLLWLQAPSEKIADLPAAAFWPSLPDTLSLPGIRTRQGEATVAGWMARIERAAGGKQPAFEHAREQRQAKKQIAWGRYLIDVSAALSGAELPPLTYNQLIDLAQGQSQSMRLAQTTLNELSDIPSSRAAPWLVTLRNLQRLAAASASPTLLEKAGRTDARLRKSLMSWLHAKPMTAPADTTPLEKQAWAQWQKVRNDAVNEATAQLKLSDRLTRGLFRPAQADATPNPLTALLPSLATLRARLSGENNDPQTQAVWALYEEDAYRLLAGAMMQSACWLNDQWKKAVIWPLDKDAEQRGYEEQQTLGQHLVRQFLQGPAQALLVAGARGSDAAAYAGIKVPLTADFIRLARQVITSDMLQDIPQRNVTLESEKRAALQAELDKLTALQAGQEKKSWKSVVSSMPATVPGGARVIPTGTRLTLHCQQGDQQLTSMNFADSAGFVWRPGQCSGVTLGVLFPDFTAHFQLAGDDAWPLFIRRFTTGETLIDSADFGDDAGLLRQLGIHQLLVRFRVSGAQQTLEASQSREDLIKQIDDLNEQIAETDARIQAQQPRALPDEPLSALPADIAECR